MSAAARPELEPGRAYRVREFRAWGANPTRLADRLVREGKLRRAARGLFYAPVASRFGPAPPEETELLRAFLDGAPFLLSGPPTWNALGLGATALFSATLVYNTKRSGEFTLDGRRFLLRRVLFPEDASPEFFVVDLLQHHDMAGVALDELERRLTATLRAGRWNRARLRGLAARFGTKATLSLVERCITAVGTSS